MSKDSALSTQKPILISVVSDLHCGSTLGLCPEEGVRLDDGGQYHPSKAQLWLWENWLDYWGRISRSAKEEKADLWLVVNGDAVEGSHHGTTQVISGNPEAQSYVQDRVFSVPLALKPTRTFIIRGTEAHVGASGNNEEALARSIKAEKDPDAKTWSWWHLRLLAHDTLLDFQHHGRSGTRPWTKASAAGILAVEIFYEHAARKERYPDLAIRSHKHTWADSGDMHPTRLIQTPAWQLKTAFAHRVVPESIADIGGIAVLVKPDGYTVTTHRYSPALPRIM